MLLLAMAAIIRHIGKICRVSNSVTVCHYHLVRHRSMASKMSLNISGIYPPIATPFDNEENVDYEKLDANLTLWNKIPFKGYVVLGSNGESPYLKLDERIEMVRRVRQGSPADKLVIAGAGCESTRDTVELIKEMAAVGADAALVVTPCFYKNGMTNDALYQHYHRVADLSPIPIILYSVPGNTGIDLSPDVIIRLAAHPNIIGLKDSAGDVAKLGNIVYKTNHSDFQVIAGSAGFLYPAMTVGCVGGICALANLLGSEVCQLYTMMTESQHDSARELQHRLIAPNAAVTRQFGVAGLKQAMDWFGYYGGPTRSPLLPLATADAHALRQAFINNGFVPNVDK